MSAASPGLCDGNRSVPAGSIVGRRLWPRLDLMRLGLVVRNLIEAWPESVYKEPIVETRVLGRNTVFLSDPELVHALLIGNADKLRRDDIVLRSLTPALGHGILTSDGETWRKQRRISAPAFRHDRLKDFVPAMMAAAEATSARWRTHPSVKMDILGEMMRTTLDVIIDTMISGEADLDAHEFGGAIGTYVEQSTWSMAFAMLGLPSQMPHPGFIDGWRSKRFLRSSVERIIERRRKTGCHGTDLLGLLLNASDPETGERMSSANLIDNLLTFVAAGHETSALTLAWTFCLIAEHPEIEARMVAEIVAAPRLAGTVHADPSALDYTRQVLMEAMRIYPAAPLVARQAIAPFKLGGIDIPAGRSVQVPIFAIHRHERLWEDPAVFNPDRFAPEANRLRKRHTYMPFSTGPRVCIGASFAMMELTVLMSILLSSFTFKKFKDGRPEARFKVTLRPAGGMPMWVQVRHPT